MTVSDGVIGIDVADDGLHALFVRRRGAASEVAGYAASNNVDRSEIGAQILRVLKALNVSDDIPVVITSGEPWPTSDDLQAILGELRESEYSVEITDRSLALARSLPDNDSGSGPVELVDCDVPGGLMRSYPGLAVRDLAGAAGAALGVLGLGTAIDPGPAAVPEPDDGTAEDGTQADAAMASAWWADEDDGATAMSDAMTIASPRKTAAAAPVETSLIGPANRRTAGFKAWMVLGLLGLLVGAGVLLSYCSGGDDAEVAAEPTPVPVVESTATPVSTATPEPEPVAAPDPTATAAPTATPEPQPDPTVAPALGTDLPPLSELPERAVIYRPPTLFLQGPMPDQQTLDAIYARAVEVLGEKNVVNEYFVHPDSPPIDADDSGVRIEAAVLFQTGSASISASFKQVLDVAVTLFELNPQMTATVQGHTDSVGSANSNQWLSERRANAVLAYLVERGVEPDRLKAVGFGSTRPVSDNDTVEGRQLNRRIEFDLEGLLDPQS